MSVAEIKKTIHERIEKISSPDQLDIVLEVLDKLDKGENSSFNIDAIFEEASNKYGSTLKRLAE